MQGDHTQSHRERLKKRGPIKGETHSHSHRNRSREDFYREARSSSVLCIFAPCNP